MIDEVVLTQRVRDEFEAVEVPEHGASDIVALLADHGVDQRRRGRQRGLIVAIAASVLLIAWALGPARGSWFAEQEDFPVSADVLGSAAETSIPAVAAPRNPVPRDDSGEDFVGLWRGEIDTRSASAGQGGGSTTGAFAPADQPKVVYTGSIDLEVERGDVGATVRRVTAIATSVNGYVAKQQSDESAGAPSATITIRVPGPEFARAVERIRELGTVLSAGSSGVDVTAEYTDLEARSRSLEAGRTQLFTVMQSAKTTGEILAVLDRITQLQTQLEQVQGRIKLLDDQTAFAAITATIRDKTPALPTEEAPKAGLAKAVDDAKDGFSRRVESIVAHSGSVFVIVATGLIGLLILRLLWPRFRRGWL